MRGFGLLCIAVCGVVVVGCGNDGGNPAAPETVLDETPRTLSNQAQLSITFHAVGNANGFACRLDGSAPAACTSPFVAAVTDGPHTFEVAAALNTAVDETPATAAWTTDITVPDTTIIKAPAAIDNTVMPELTFTGSDPGGGAITFECSLDAAAFAACTSPIVLTVADGPHTFQVRTVDLAGNPDPTPASHAWTVDTSAPDTTITAGPAAGSTTATGVTFSFSSSDAAATFECSLDAGAFAACTTPDALTLTDGSHTFTVRANNALGIVDPTPASRTWTVDGIAPVIAITQTPANPSNDTSPTFAFTADTAATFECQIDGVSTFAACTSPWDGPAVTDGSQTFSVRATDGVGNQATATFTWLVDTAAPTVVIDSGPSGLVATASASFAFTTGGSPTAIACSVDGSTFSACSSPTPLAVFTEGMHVFVVRVTDAAGNTGMDLRTFEVDTTPPVVMITSGPPNPTNNPTPAFTFVATGATVLACGVDAAGFAPCTSPLTTATLTNGTHTFTVRATDAAGNSATASRTFDVDTVAPVVTITSAPNNPTNDTTPTVVFSTSGTPTAVECQVDGGTFSSCAIGTFTAAALPDGPHTITVRATDAATNQGSATASFVIDTQGPTVTIVSAPSNPTRNPIATVTFSTTGSPTSVVCSVDGGPTTSCIAGTFTTGTLTDTTHTLLITAADAAGNQGSASTSFEVDTTPPDVQIASGPIGDTGDNTPTFTFTTGGNPVTTACRFDATPFAACTSPITPAALADGPHVFEVKVTDAAGNSATATRAFAVDTANPTVTITVPPPSPSQDSTPTVGFTVLGATTIDCRVDLGAFVTCSSPFTSGALPDGMHAITVRGTDGVGNTGSASTSFVIDNDPPTVVITGGPTGATSNPRPTFTFATGGAPTITECRIDTDAFAPCTSPYTPATPLGDAVHTFTVRVTDAATNAATASRGFTVDTIGPTVTISAPLSPTRDTTPNVVFTTAGAAITTQCSVDGGPFVDCTSPFTIGPALPDGDHSVTIQATDAAANVGSSTRPFTVDTVAPALSFTTVPPASTNDNTPDVAFSAGADTVTLRCRVGTGALGACTTGSTFTAPTLTDGPHTIHVQATDLAGNLAQITTSFTIDTVPPTVTITVPPANPTTDDTPTVTFTTAGTPSTVQCQVDGGALTTCSGTFTTSSLSDASHTITIVATDLAGNQGVASTTFVVDHINDAPVAADDSFTTNEDVAATGNVLGNDSDPNTGVGDTITAVLDVGPVHGALVLGANGAFTYTPNADSSGPDGFTYHAKDAGNLASNIATVALTINAVDDQPVAVDDLGSTNEDTTSAAINVLANDLGTGDGGLVVTIVTQGAKGTATVNASNQIIYTPAASLNGSDTITYRVTDVDGDSDTGDLVMTINPVDDQPVAVDDTGSTNEDTTSGPISVLFNDTGTGDGGLVVTIVTQGTKGTATVNAGNQVIYTPAANLNGTDTITYRVTDVDGDTGTGNLVMTINPVDDLPIAVDDTGSTNEDTASAPISVLVNDTNLGDGGLVVTIVTQGAKGTATVNASNQIIYTPSADLTGTDTITYRVTDVDGDADTGDLVMTINPTDDPPVAVADTATVTEDSIATTIDVLTNDTDIDAGPRSVSAVGTAAHGTVVLAGGIIKYTPNANYCNNPPGTVLDTFTYTLSPGSSSSSVSITVTCVDDAPTDGDESAVAQANVGIVVPAGAGLLANATDPENDALTIAVASQGTHPTTQGGSITIAADGSYAYKPQAGDRGITDAFTYTVTDGTLGDTSTVTFNVNTDVIWFVDLAGGAGDGTLANPFNTLAALDDTGANPDAAGDTIFVYTSDATPGAVTLTNDFDLQNNQVLVGEGTGTAGDTIDVVRGFTPAPNTRVLPVVGTTRPVITATSGDIITLANGNTIRGVDLADSVGAHIAGTSFGTLSIGNVGISGFGETLKLATGTIQGIGGGPASFATLSSTSTPDDGLSLSFVTGSIAAIGTLSEAALATFKIVGGSVSVTYTGNLAQDNSGALVSISGGHTGAVTFAGGGILTATAGTGLQFDNADGAYNFNGTTTLNGGDASVDIVNGSGGAFSFGAATTITSPTGIAFNVNAATGPITYGGSISKTSNGQLISLADYDTGTAAFAGTLACTASCTGISVQNDGAGAGNVTFSGASKTISSGGVALGNNAGGTIRFLNGGLAITGTGATTGLQATGGGTVEVIGTGNTISSGTGVALKIDHTTIGSGGLTFQSISSSGGSNNGITLDTTGASGGLTVTGDGSNATLGGNASGGTIANKSGGDGSTTAGTGIYLNSTKNVVLRRMTINGTNQNYGIRGTNVDGFTLEYATVAGVNGTAATLGAPENAGEGSIYFGNYTAGVAGITTSGTITSCIVNGGRARNVSVINGAGTLDRLTITGTTFGLNQDFADASQSLAVEARRPSSGTARVNVTVTGSTFAGSPGDLANFTSEEPTSGIGVTMDVVFSGNTLSNSHARNVIGGGGFTIAGFSTTFSVTNNTFRGAHGSAVTLQLGAPVPSSTVATSLVGTFANNTIGVTGVAGSGSQTGNGLFMAFADNTTAPKGQVTLAITGNTILDYNGAAGILADNSGGDYNLDLTVTGNTTAQPGTLAAGGFLMAAGAPISADDIDVCAKIGDPSSAALRNDFSAGGQPSGDDVLLGVSSGASTMRLPGYAGTTLADVQSFVLANNNFGGTVVTAYVDSPATAANYVGGATCALP